MRLSDSLHGAADKAPVDGMQISAVEAARRVQRRRSLRAGGTGLLATAGVALLAVGVVAPNLGGSSGSDGADMAAGLPETAMDDAGGTMLASGFCGGTVEGLAYGDSPVTLDAALTRGDADVTAYEPAEMLSWETTTTARDDVSLGAGRPLTYAYVLWDGVVVGKYPGPDDVFTDDLFLLDLESGESYTDESGIELVNCWDGAPLPAADYELVLAQEFWSTEPIAEPTLPTDPDSTAAPEETGVPEPDLTEESVDPVEPTVEPLDPDSAVSNDNGDASSSGMADSDMGTSTDGAASSGLAADQGFRVVAEPLAFTIDGDRIEDPFAQYLGVPEPAPGPVETPDDLLTPDTARSLYEQGLTGAWDMAAGSQRVVLTNDSTQTDGDLWSRQWFGCSYEPGVDSAFPSESAVIDLVDVSAPLPSRVSVSYGWIVDGNPAIDAAVTNVSDWTLPFWDGGQPNLVLVQDGRVVAQAYPTNADRNGGIVMMEGAADSAESSLIAPEYFTDGFMSPGEAYTGTYLWRDVSTCDQIGSLAAGTYTVLDQRSIYVDSGAGYYEYDMPAVEEGAAVEGFASDGESTEGSSGAADAMPVPDPDANYDWVELTVWTSLGTVTVTT
ncbi:hypothetical protein [Demequina zhanjiangensis]|uniref:Uncharacterized protein n=1 Tax=Demequina zhanjiangensis TaxID=3051659 RepID=A0ABT8FYW6_9MICO|nr:hypothetical protein [Demequina sp. SYSU T00b26]MDN4472096.1 hypothetical protein [Demequina sp. SYSU T00b26]